MARRTQKDSARSIEEVAQGERLLEDIKDRSLRETVRLALRLHKDPFTAPDGPTRARIRLRVLRALHPHPASFFDRLVVAFELLALPAPYAMRVLAIVAIALSAVASTTVASANAVANDALYGVKIASERARLALATTPEDRAIVQLSIAEHRLAEATALASVGNDDDAVVATSEYGEHLANAAAELAQMESLTTEAQALVLQFQQKIDVHRATAAAAAARLADSPVTAGAAEALALIASHSDLATDDDLSPAAAIASRAADATDQIATVAERKLAPLVTARAGTTVPAGTEVRSADARILTADRSRGERAAEIARRAADEARAAAQKAKQGSRRGPNAKLTRPG